MNILAVYFDLDGTLLDSLEDISDAVNVALRQAGYPEHPLEHYRLFTGNRIKELIEASMPPGEAQRQPHMVRELGHSMRAHYAKNLHNKTRPYPGIVQLIHSLEKRHIPLAVLSNKEHEATVTIVEHFFPAVFTMVEGAKNRSRLNRTQRLCYP